MMNRLPDQVHKSSRTSCAFRIEKTVSFQFPSESRSCSVYREHIKQDDKRFDGIKEDLTALIARQTEISDKMASNHTEILKTLLQAANQRETNAAIAAARE